jgi:hypothetical protein
MEDFDYDKMYEIISEMNKSTKEKCLICHIPIEEKELELTCKHQYHFKCINKTTGNFTCPYCGKLNKLESLFNKNISNNINECKFKILSGINKGQYCKRINCGYHKKILTNKIDDNICHNIMKSGPRKGEECGRSNCKYHQIII